jgi:hypothetical protein
VSATAYSIYSQLSFVPAGRLLRPQAKGAPNIDDRDLVIRDGSRYGDTPPPQRKEKILELSFYMQVLVGMPSCSINVGPNNFNFH